jgi:hypothetical protein
MSQGVEVWVPLGREGIASLAGVPDAVRSALYAAMVDHMRIEHWPGTRAVRVLPRPGARHESILRLAAVGFGLHRHGQTAHWAWPEVVSTMPSGVVGGAAPAAPREPATLDRTITTGINTVGSYFGHERQLEDQTRRSEIEAYSRQRGARATANANTTRTLLGVLDGRIGLEESQRHLAASEDAAARERVRLATEKAAADKKRDTIIAAAVVVALLAAGGWYMSRPKKGR